MIKTFYFNDLRTCCYIVYDAAGKCAIVDPGCYKQSEKDRLVKFVEENNLTPLMIIQTHGHFDHVMGNAFVSEKWNIPTYLNENDWPQVQRSSSYAGYFGYIFDNPSDKFVNMNDGDIINIGEISLKVFATPGHTAGGVVLYNEAEGYLLTGDTIFQGSVGRTDLPGGDYDMLMESIKTKILTLPSSTQIYPGHGPSTSIAFESMNNPFIV